jgi:hypothetical protein
LPDGSRPPNGAVVETAAGFYMMSNGSGVKVTPTSVTTSDGRKVTGYNAGGTTYMLGGSRPTKGSTVHTSGGDYLMTASGGVKVGSGFGLRPPDYATLTIGGGIPQYGIQLQIIEESSYSFPGYSTTGGNVLASKTNHTQRDSGLVNVPDEEISRRARDKTLSSQERQRYIKEEKIRGLRNKQKRNHIERLEEITGLAGGALVAYLIISEGSRLFPPRNLIPVP